jgi:hypothetical protein
MDKWPRNSAYLNKFKEKLTNSSFLIAVFGANFKTIALQFVINNQR